MQSIHIRISLERALQIGCFKSYMITVGLTSLKLEALVKLTRETLLPVREVQYLYKRF